MPGDRAADWIWQRASEPKNQTLALSRAGRNASAIGRQLRGGGRCRSRSWRKNAVLQTENCDFAPSQSLSTTTAGMSCAAGYAFGDLQPWTFQLERLSLTPSGLWRSQQRLHGLHLGPQIAHFKRDHVFRESYLQHTTWKRMKVKKLSSCASVSNKSWRLIVMLQRWYGAGTCGCKTTSLFRSTGNGSATSILPHQATRIAGR